MKKINWIKNQQILRERGHSIDQVIAEGILLDVRDNPGYSDQRIEIYHFNDYVWAVIVGSNPSSYITMYKSRKLKKEFDL